jgi:hypothetical protein
LAGEPVHGFFVAWITGVVWLGLAEWAAHVIVDYGKCRHRYTLAFDQFLHLVCKVIWVLLIFSTGSTGSVRLIQL